MAANPKANQESREKDTWNDSGTRTQRYIIFGNNRTAEIKVFHLMGPFSCYRPLDLLRPVAAKTGIFVGALCFVSPLFYGRSALEGGRAAEDAAVVHGRIFLTLGWHWNNFALILKILYRVKQMLHLLFNQAN
jgi:hypothetical protein